MFREKSGYAGADIAEYGQPGSNGLTIDPQGRLTINEHGNHCVTRLEKDRRLTVLADRYQGKRLNSPNDLVYKSDGALYFTDPPFGLPKFFDDPRKELPFSGVYRWRSGKLQLLATDLTGSNGLAFPPDEKYLYVANWDTHNKVVMRYPVNAEGTLAKGEVFFDMTDALGEEALDGLKVDQQGHLYVSGPGGIWILRPWASTFTVITLWWQRLTSAKANTRSSFVGVPRVAALVDRRSLGARSPLARDTVGAGRTVDYQTMKEHEEIELTLLNQPQARLARLRGTGG